MAKICSYQLATFQHYTYKNNAFSKLALDNGNHASADASATAAIAHPSAPIAGRPGLPCRWRSPRSPLPVEVLALAVTATFARLTEIVIYLQRSCLAPSTLLHTPAHSGTLLLASLNIPITVAQK